MLQQQNFKVETKEEVLELQFKPLTNIVVQNSIGIIQKDDFVIINGRYEAKRDALIKILTNLPVNFNIEIVEEKVMPSYAKVKVKLTITFQKTGMVRSSENIAFCEDKELHDKSLHNMYTKAETRAIKRCIESVFGSVVNQLILLFHGEYQPSKH